MLEVGAPGHDRTQVLLGLAGESVDEVEHERADRQRVVEQVGAEQRRDLVVAGTTGSQLAAGLRADLLDEQPLERAVHVLVGRVGQQLAVREPQREHVEAAVQLGLLRVGEQPGRRQGLRVGMGAGDVVQRQPPVEVRRAGQRLQLG